MIERLKDIPRIGGKTARRFIEHFGSEKQAIDSIMRGDIAAISEIDGMSEKSAISLVIEASALNEGVSLRDFLKTGESYEIYKRILEIITGFARTDYAKSKLQLYIPYPACKKDRILELQKRIGIIIGMTNALQENEISDFLSRIRPVKTKTSILVIRDRVFIAATPQEFEAAKKFPIAVQLVDNAGEAVDIARGYPHVLISTAFAGMDFPEELDIDFIDIKKAETWQVAPEQELSFFSKNLESISCAISVARVIRKHNPNFINTITDGEIDRLEALLMKIGGNMELKSGVDIELDRKIAIRERLNEVISEAEGRANLEFGSLIEKSSITIKGFDLLSAMNGSINRLFEKEIREKYNKVAEKAMHAIAEELGLNPAEVRYLNNFFGEEVSYPLKVNPRASEELKNHLFRGIASRKLVLLRETASQLSSLREAASLLVREVLDFDVSYSIACFVRKFDLSIPLIQESMGIGVVGGKNLFLENPVPINYTVGASQFSDCTENRDARVVLLSGVNSGGKTSTIDLLAQIIILAHMGFCVPAKRCEIGLVEEFYYFGKSSGTMDAGAFESTIVDFAAVAGKKSKIVLTDEMESITEPGASAKIISGILEELDDNNGLGVFVSHIAESVLKNTDHSIRVDGIEAEGLDENMNLIVDRNPRYNYLAKSTPELIVERLARKNQDNEFYKRLLKKFK